MIRIFHIRRSFQAANSYGWSEFINYLQQQSRHICSLHIYVKLVQFKYTLQHIQGSTECPLQYRKLHYSLSFWLVFPVCIKFSAAVAMHLSAAMQIIWNAWIQFWDSALIACIFSLNAAEKCFSLQVDCIPNAVSEEKL